MKESKICQALYQTGNLLPVDSGQKSMSFANVDGLMDGGTVCTDISISARLLQVSHLPIALATFNHVRNGCLIYTT